MTRLLSMSAAEEAKASPPGRAAVRMAWRDLLFLHWPIEPVMVQHLLPSGLELDTFDGCAWVGLIPFRMPVVRAFGLPLPGGRSVLECNVRTYVRCGNETGVWFFSLDADSISTVHSARTFWRLNYRHSRMTTNRNGDRFEYNVQRSDHERRAHIAQRFAIASNDKLATQPTMHCVWEVGDALPQSQPGDLEHFLTERYALYTLNRRGNVVVSRIHHEPWRLREARVIELSDSLVAAAGLHVNKSQRAEPIAFHADGLDTQAWRLVEANAL